MRTPEVGHQVGNRLTAHGKDIEPEQNGPETVLLAHMVAACTCAFLAAERDLARVEQVAEELPAGRRLVAFNAKAFGHPVRRPGGGH